MTLLQTWPAGLHDARPADCIRLALASIRGLARSRRPEVLTLLLMLAFLAFALATAFSTAWPGQPALAGATGVLAAGAILFLASATSWMRLILGNNSRVFISAEAVAAVRATEEDGTETWELSDHLSFRPGAGRASRFRQQLWPDLIAAINTHGVDTRLRTSHPKVNAIYIRELNALGWTLAPIAGTKTSRLARQEP